jgi:ring-1,2-phenylacetyl-CoA epoxidase subunit PaaC
MTSSKTSSSLAHIAYILQIADNALVIGHRLSEWCGHGPALEQDIAITNTALDHIGQSRGAYQHAANLYNALSPDEQRRLFTSPAIQGVSDAVDEDDIAYLRDVWDFKNCLLTEQPNGDWAYTIARSFFYDTFQFLFYAELQKSPDEELAAIAEKSFKEVSYHRRWSSEWMIRLGDGTTESRERLQRAVDARWMFTGELFAPSAADQFAHDAGIGPDLASLKEPWMKYVRNIMDEATLTVPTEPWMQEGGKEGRHSEHLGYILAELQFMQRAYPNMEW